MAAMSDDANLPVIPDKVVDRIRGGQPVALEEVSSAAAEMKAASTTARAAPLRAEGLKPISRAQANTLMTGNPQGTIQRGSVPRAPATRRVIPAPFKRERISIRVPGEPQPGWATRRADQVREGDIVPDVGRVVDITRQTRYSDASEQVPVEYLDSITPQPVIRKVVEYTPEMGVLLGKSYGSTRVAVGVDIVLTGPEGCQIVVDEKAEVQVFGLPR